VCWVILSRVRGRLSSGSGLWFGLANIIIRWRSSSQPVVTEKPELVHSSDGVINIYLRRFPRRSSFAHSEQVILTWEESIDD
jgi:hypothetical protein